MAEAPHSEADFSDEEQSPLDLTFNRAADHIRKITNKLDNNQLLELYGLFKQSSEGTCNTTKPGFFDQKGRRKWEAWKALGELHQTEAKQKYIALVQKYSPEWSQHVNAGPKESWITVSSLRHSPEPDLVHHELSLIEAAREDIPERVTLLLNENPSLKYEKDDDGLTALHWAADRNSINALKAALNAGCPIDAVDDCGQTALHYASSCGHVESVKILLDAGAQFLRDEDGNTPLDVASDEEIRKLLYGALP